MKAMILMGAMILSSISANAGSNVLHQCKTELGKDVEVAYSSSERLDKVVIDGATYTNDSHLTLTRDGAAMIFVGNFRNSETLQLVIEKGINQSFYRLQGKEKPLNCQTTKQRGSSSGSI